MSRLIRFLLAVLLPNLAACTVVRIEGAAHRVHVAAGRVRVEPARPGGIVVARTTGIGLVGTAAGATLGYAHETAIYAPAAPSCAIILLEPDLPTARAIIAAMTAAGADIGTICSSRGTE